MRLLRLAAASPSVQTAWNSHQRRASLLEVHPAQEASPEEAEEEEADRSQRILDVCTS